MTTVLGLKFVRRMMNLTGVGFYSAFMAAEKIDVYTFSVGVRKLCLEKKMQLCFTPWDKAYPDVKSIFSYMKKIGCSDLILDLLVDTAKMAKYPNKKFNQKNRTYDENGKLIK